MARGKLKWFNENKGFGFIEVNGKQDVFVHYSALENMNLEDFIEGVSLDFNIIDCDTGPQAEKVKIIKDAHDMDLS